MTVPGKAAGHAAAELPWLCPTTDSLIALADVPSALAGVSAADPALSAFLLRFARLDGFVFTPGALLAAQLPETAAAYLGSCKAGFPATCGVAMTRVRSVVARAGAIAAIIAEETRLVPAAAAATVARLAPLGWYAVAAVNSCAAADPLVDQRFCDRPAEVQADLWGLDHAAITRRLAGRWRLPGWVATTIGCLTLPLRTAVHLVTQPDLFAVVQLATLEAEAAERKLGLTHGAERSELLDHLGLHARGLEAVLARLPAPKAPAPSAFDPDPHKVPLVRNLLLMAGESRRRNGAALVARLEEHVDRAHRAAAELGERAGDRLRDAKLDGLAELAAGAGHEINNPLAVISGNAQRLLRTEPDPDRGGSLAAIVRQANRIAAILRDLMHFARPPRPDPRTFPVADLVHGACDDVAALAAERGVVLEVEGVPAGVWLDGDPKQLRHALAALVRNGVEACGPHGWVRVSCSARDGGVAVTIDDNGPGLTPEAVAHAFDPFFCGRSAGRGRGLGLPTAWQLVRQNGGDLRFEPTRGGPTRFVLTLRGAARDIRSLRVG